MQLFQRLKNLFKSHSQRADEALNEMFAAEAKRRALVSAQYPYTVRVRKGPNYHQWCREHFERRNSYHIEIHMIGMVYEFSFEQEVDAVMFTLAFSEHQY